MKFGRVLVAAALAGTIEGAASAGTIDFNSAVAPGSSTVVIDSVSITRAGGQNILFEDNSPNGTRALVATGVDTSQWTATFPTLQSRVSIVLGDFGFDSDTIFLTALDSSNNPLGTVSQVLPSTLSEMVTLATLTVEFPNIKSVVFGTTGGLGGIYADNLIFSPVPIPALLPIFAAALGLLGFMGWRRRRGTARV